MEASSDRRPSFAPRNWSGWIAVALFFLLGMLPQRVGIWLTEPLGPLLCRFATRRRKVAERNLERCLPELDEAERERILRGCFRSLARMIAETAWCWSPLRGRIKRIGQVHGLEHLFDAEEQGRGVLVLTSHNTCLEIGGCILGYTVQGRGVYRPMKNEVIEWYQNRRRRHYIEGGLIAKRDVRAMIRLLRNGGMLWYAPDQDFGPDQSVFAPFFGIQTATLLATYRLPKMTGCALVPMFPRYDRKRRRYDVYLYPALEDFPTDDPVADLSRINAVLERQVREEPEQYWWIHRRFKTRPEGEPPFYD
ncbi:MAG: LpxL/LpxP family Kdo(2)-lipid IV(A) lauroyl/palmitoleoyl acyltransferase [Xanthomonadales bacterium]|nr:LpxL/LpxP family Kdo(2)-lipid IV(A) lauroyl/palmitoleoyl acyltransferase [Xanthomonadales bacterium]NIX14177.1 LpxL/LpxP family Kdo(2)-lipid IV(A) lauroyl/palmitoleoyl acyltransferase [Xanthomonadales bacterium]